jgi:hypothetical protein
VPQHQSQQQNFQLKIANARKSILVTIIGQPTTVYIETGGMRLEIEHGRQSSRLTDTFLHFENFAKYCKTFHKMISRYWCWWYNVNQIVHVGYGHISVLYILYVNADFVELRDDRRFGFRISPVDRSIVWMCIAISGFVGHCNKLSCFMCFSQWIF